MFSNTILIFNRIEIFAIAPLHHCNIAMVQWCNGAMGQLGQLGQLGQFVTVSHTRAVDISNVGQF